MASSSAGSNVFVVLAFLLISLTVFLILRRYLPFRSTPAYLSIPIFLALVLPTSAIILVPIDLASSQRVVNETSKGIWLPERAVLVLWRIIYWLTFVLTWMVLPLLGEYMDSGYRDPRARMIYSLRSNGRYQLTVLACAVTGLVYMIISVGFDFQVIKSLAMALAYVWGLILAIYLMGHGLVAVPRRMLKSADIAGSLRLVQARAPRVHENLEDAVIELEDIEAQIQQLKQRKTGTARSFQNWIDDLSDLTGQLPSRITLATPDLSTGSTIPNVITERYLADLTRRFERARQRRARYVEEWDSIVETASDLQKIIDSMASQQLVFGKVPTGSIVNRISILTPWLRHQLYVHVLPGARYALFGIFSLASVAIIQSELIRPFLPQYSIVSLTVVHKPSSKSYQVGFGGQLLAATWITYMVFCALSSITVVPTWNQRALVRRNTTAESACWYAGQIAKLTVPLAYNFLTFLPTHIQDDTTFDHFLGRLINLTSLGSWFNTLFPMIVLIPVCATLFNLYGRVKSVLGFDSLMIDDADEEDQSAFSGGWREGRDLIARDLSGPHAQGQTFGLTSDGASPRTSTDRPSRGQPTLWVPPAQRSSAISPNRNGGSGGAPGFAGRSGASAGPRRTATQPLLDAEPEEENFFTLFGRRVKNTIDGIETPRWMQNGSNATANNNSSSADARGGNSSGFKFTRPKWMGGDGDDDDNNDTNFVDRLFGSTNNTGGGRTAGRNEGRIVL